MCKIRHLDCTKCEMFFIADDGTECCEDPLGMVEDCCWQQRWGEELDRQGLDKRE